MATAEEEESGACVPLTLLPACLPRLQDRAPHPPHQGSSHVDLASLLRRGSVSLEVLGLQDKEAELLLREGASGRKDPAAIRRYGNQTSSSKTTAAAPPSMPQPAACIRPARR